jgi:hypothetical protein
MYVISSNISLLQMDNNPQGIAPTLIVLRVAMGLSYDTSERTRTPMIFTSVIINSTKTQAQQNCDAEHTDPVLAGGTKTQ